MLGLFKNRFSKLNRFGKNVATLAGASVIAQIIVVLSSPILTRIYSAEQFGVLGTMLTISTIVASVASLRLEQALPISENTNTRINIACLSLLVCLLSALLLYCTCPIWCEYVRRYGGSEIAEATRWFIPLSVVCQSVFSVLVSWGLSEKIFKKIAISLVIQRMTAVACQIAVGAVLLHTNGLLAGYLIGLVAAIVCLAYGVIQCQAARISTLGVRSMWAVLVRYKRFPLVATWAALLNTLGLHLPTLILVTAFDAGIAGFYFLVQRIIAGPIQLVGGSISQVFIAEAGELIRTGKPGIGKISASVMKKLLVVAALVGGLIALIAPPLFGRVFGEEWAPAGKFVVLLMPSLVLKIGWDSVINFNLIERQDLALIWAGMRCLAMLVILWSVSKWGLSVEEVVMGISSVLAICYFAKKLMWSKAIRKIDNTEGQTNNGQ